MPIEPYNQGYTARWTQSGYIPTGEPYSEALYAYNSGYRHADMLIAELLDIGLAEPSANNDTKEPTNERSTTNQALADIQPGTICYLFSEQ